ncbi:Leucine-rich repeat-containing protein 15 [Papilio machaon]|uniref:Leucine-rich repeat-containing protein 15 n=1 Tax=Papilio machaon TaxID=76193 RepID=A0A194RU31_PAPMA|nr:Leucine-rich repeat-containing protein 15 [Papilio machaon]
MYLNLSYNLLSELELGLFDEKPNLKLLDLRGNTIFLLKFGIFDLLKKIQHIDLSSNSLLGREINPYTFDSSKEIQFIDFSRNDMSESPDNLLHAFRALDFLNLDRCFLKEVPRFATIPNLKNLKHLMLSTNLISKIDNAAIFVNLDNLEILNLAENCLEYINEKSLKPLRNLKMIVLRDNKLKHISDDLFRNLPVLGIVDLSHNALTSVPVSMFKGTAIKNLNLSHNKITYLEYNFCLELKNIGGKLSKFFFNQNPWQCSCLRELLREVKALNVGYNSVMYNGEHPVCVTDVEFVCHRDENYNDVYVKMFENLIS